MITLATFSKLTFQTGGSVERRIAGLGGLETGFACLAVSGSRAGRIRRSKPHYAQPYRADFTVFGGSDPTEQPFEDGSSARPFGKQYR